MPLDQNLNLNPSDDKYKDAKYLLNLHIGSFEIEIQRLCDVKTKQNARKYYEYMEHKPFINKVRKPLEAPNSHKVHCILLLHDLSPSNTVEHILERGVHIPEGKAMLCSCGYHELDFIDGYRYKAVLCEVALKKTKKLKPTDITNEVLEDLEFRDEYDSIFISKNDKEDKRQKHPYENDFVIFESDQILPLYYAEFEHKKNSQGVCNICKVKRADVYCVNDEMDLCVECDQSSHSNLNSLTTYHNRISIKEKPAKYSLCPTHNLPMELVCKECVKQLCINCKLIGHHSNGLWNKHNLVSVSSCFNFLKKTKKKKTAQMKNLSKMIKKHIKNLEKKIDKMTVEFKRVESQIFSIYKRAMVKLKQIKKANLHDLESACTIMKNRLNELKWMEYFTKFQIDYIEPEEFIQLNFTHQRMQNLFYRNMKVPGTETYKKHSNFEVYGDIQIADCKKSSDTQEKKRREREMKMRIRKRMELQQQTLRDGEMEFYSELEAQMLENQGLTENAKYVKRNSLLTNRTKRNSIHINQKRLSILGSLPKVSIPDSVSTRVPASTNRLNVPGGGDNFMISDRNSLNGSQGRMRTHSDIGKIADVKPVLIDSADENANQIASLNEIKEENGMASKIKKTLSKKSKEMAEVLIKKFGANELNTKLEDAFSDTEIIMDHSYARYLYLNCIDPDMDTLPTTENIEIYSDNDMPSSIDVIKSIITYEQPIVFILKFRGEAFGGFSATNWRSKNDMGNKMNFLFNLGKDLRITADKSKNKNKLYQWRNDNEMGWGSTDLIFHDNGCFSSKLGSTYCVHQALTEEEAKTYLCGEYRFIPEIFEIWRLDYTI